MLLCTAFAVCYAFLELLLRPGDAPWPMAAQLKPLTVPVYTTREYRLQESAAGLEAW
jgi:hypothetical protein